MLTTSVRVPAANVFEECTDTATSLTVPSLGAEHLFAVTAMWLLNTIVYSIGVVLLVLAGVFCLATGLYTAAEWLEDHVKTTFRIIKRGTIICASLQLLWLVCDQEVFWPNLVGLASHANSWYMLKRYYPSHMGLDQPSTILALALLVVHQTVWVLTWTHEASSFLHILAILATVVWPIPIVLLLSAGTDSELPIRMPVSLGGESMRSSIPNSPSQSGSPVVDAARLRMRHNVPQRSSMDARASTDINQQHDQATGLANSLHARKGSAGSDGSFSSSFSAAWGLAERLQQQRGFKKHRSRFVQAMHTLQHAVGMQPAAAVLPVAVDTHRR